MEKPTYYTDVCPQCEGPTPPAEIDNTYSAQKQEPTRIDGTWNCPQCGTVMRRIK